VVALINICRFAMLAWIVYGVLMIFAPSLIHHEPDAVSGIIQYLLAYGAGFLLDRLLGLVRRRRAARESDV
jgi:hypothetical protein